MDSDYREEVLVEFKNLGRLNITGEADFDLKVHKLDRHYSRIVWTPGVNGVEKVPGQAFP